MQSDRPRCARLCCQVAKMTVANMRLGHKRQLVYACDVLAKQKDFDVLLDINRCLLKIGAEKEAAKINAALAGETSQPFVLVTDNVCPHTWPTISWNACKLLFSTLCPPL